MALDHDTVAAIAHLARLAIPDDELGRHAAELDNILGMVERMNRVDTSQVSPMAHPLDATQRLRPDAVTETDRREQFQAGAPAVRDGLYLVPRVVE